MMSHAALRAFYSTSRRYVSTPVRSLCSKFHYTTFPVGQHQHFISSSTSSSDDSYYVKNDNSPPRSGRVLIPDSVSTNSRSKIQTLEVEYDEEALKNIEEALGRQLKSFENTQSIGVDRSGLLKAKEFEKMTEEVLAVKEKKTPLVDFLREMIQYRNPLPLSEFMQICLTHPDYGYYSTKSNVLGSEGDFVTSPEITPVFNELMCVWVISTWKLMGEPSRFQLVECGPGKGTMMKGILDTAFELRKVVPGFYDAISVQLVETSAVMRSYQAEQLDVNLDVSALGADKANLISFPSAVARESQSEAEWKDSNDARMKERLAFFCDTEKPIQGTTHGRTSQGMDGALIDNKDSRVHVQWLWRVEDIVCKEGEPLIVLGHEFLDALPVRQFQRTERGWCERMVDLHTTTDSPYFFQYALAPSSQTASAVYLPPNDVLMARKEDTIEVSPGVQAVTQAVCDKLSTHGGAALFIDYGADYAPALSVQAVRDHKHVHIFEQPGQSDLTAHVDFSGMRRIAETFESIQTYPLVTQRELLRELGIGPRVENLLANATNADEENAQNLHDAYLRLVSDESEHEHGMGILFKAFCVTNIPALPKDAAPVGFMNNSQ